MRAVEELQCSYEGGAAVQQRESCGAAKEEEDAGLLQGKLAAGCASDSRWECRRELAAGEFLARSSRELGQGEWPAECREKMAAG